MEFVKKNTKIYILSGKSGSGKDTVASMIKNMINKKVISLAYASYLKMYAKEVLGWDGNDPKPRDFLQQLGVELIKNNIDKKMLVRRMIEDIKVYNYFYDVIIITDARFPDEIDDIKANFDNVTVLHLSDRENKLTDKEKMHATETSLNNYNNYDYVVSEDNLDDLSNTIEKIIGETYDSRD
nr:hypothetical protein [Bacilli bacterium]